LLYIIVVRDGDGEEIVVKFTCRYCIELRAFRVINQHALGILGYQKLPRNCIIIAMDYMSAKSTTTTKALAAINLGSSGR
jgi:hypothetical protein